MILFIDIHRINKSSWYLYPKNFKTFEDILSTDKLAGLYFQYKNIINFWMIGLAALKIEKTIIENIVSWLKNDFNDS